MKDNSCVTKDNRNTMTIIFSIVLIIIAIACMLIYFTKGKVTISGSLPGDQQNPSLQCVANNLNYPFFRYDESKGKTTEINAIFYNDKLGSISIIHTLYYDNIDQADGSEAQNHASMGIHFAKDGLGSDPFSAHYSKQQDRMSMTLYAKSSELSEISGKYFLINDIDIGSPIETYENMYKSLGFICTKTEQIN